MIKSIAKSLSARVILLSFLVHLIMISIALVNQNRLFNEIDGLNQSGPSAALYIIEDYIYSRYSDNIGEDQNEIIGQDKPNLEKKFDGSAANKKKQIIELSKADFSTDSRLLDVVERNSDFWFYYEFEQTKLAFKYGRVPSMLQSLATENVRQLKPTSTCTELTFPQVIDDLEVSTLFVNCAETGVTLLDVGGVNPNYSYEVPLIDVGSAYWLNQARPMLLSYLMLMLITPLFIYFMIRPVSRASRVARRISPYSKEKTLPADGIFTEALGLVESVNSALKRLDAGYKRERWLRDVIAHELRTPLTIFRARVHDIEDADLRNELIADLHKINELIERLIEFSKATALSNKAEPSPLVDEVRAACVECGVLALKSKVEIDFNYSEKVNHLIDVDNTIVFIVLTNLINNAIKHSDSNAAVSVAINDDGKIVVSDQGVGMDIDLYQSFFDTFSLSRVDNVRQHGLGLVIVAELMQHSGGKIKVFQSELGGVAYSVCFPLIEPHR